MTASLDPRSSSDSDTTYQTNYAYDGHGNVIAMALPTIGAYRPTSLYSYDAYNNITAYCDPNYTHKLNSDWTAAWTATPPTSDTLCPTTQGTPTSPAATVYTWSTTDYNSDEPYGRLTNTYRPMGYHTQIYYASGPQGGTDVGLPSEVQGDQISQTLDSTTRQPTQEFEYDGYGNLVCYAKLVDSATHWWRLTYDGVNRRAAVADPDDASLSVSQCTNTAGISGSHIVTATSYFANDDVASTQTPSEFAQGVSTTYTYDADGNKTTEVRHFANTAGNTQYWYDGADRLVEVQQPKDTSDLYTNAWTTRYLYDLSQDTTVTLSGSSSVSYDAHGNLFKTQEVLPSKTSDSSVMYTVTSSQTHVSNTVFADISGTAFDTLDRPTAKYQFIGDVPKAETFAYDTSSDFGDVDGLLAEHCNALSQCGIPNYDAAAREIHIQYTDSTPTEDTVYDADGHVLSATSSTFGAQSYTYDADGKMLVSTDPNKSGSGVTGGATQITHNYYPDGMLASIDVSAPNATMNGSAFAQTGLFQYAYRNDGKLQTQAIQLPQNTKVGTTKLAFSYTSGGRQTQRTESGPGANATAVTFSYSANSGDPTVDGKLTGATFPGGNVTVSGYDAEGDLSGYTPTQTGNPDPLGAYSYTYTERGEISFETADTTNKVTPAYVNGLVLSLPAYIAAVAPQTVSWDGRRAVQVGSSIGNEGTTSEYGTGQFTYDNAGRQTEDSNNDTTVDNCNSKEGQFNVNLLTANSSTRSYDAENRIIGGGSSGSSARIYGSTCSTITTWTSVALGYDWGPNGHPIRVGASAQASSTSGPPKPGSVSYDTLHWDGDQMLFTTNRSGVIDDIKVGSIGDITPLDPGFTGLTFWDRLFGKILYCHNNTGEGGNGESASLFQNIPDAGCWPYVPGEVSRPTSFAWTGTTYGTTLNLVGQGALLAMPRADGFTDGFNVIQGVRSMDPNQGTWTTPDAYAGVVKDPVSQKAYMWNNNDPVMYSDPNGYCPQGDWACVDREIESFSNPLLFFLEQVFEPGDVDDGGDYAHKTVVLYSTQDPLYDQKSLPISA